MYHMGAYVAGDPKCGPIRPNWDNPHAGAYFRTYALLRYILCFPYLKGDLKMAITRIPRIPRTRAEKGRAWATATLVVCGAFSIYANVRSGQLYRDSVIVSVVPPIVAFLSSHLISYFNPVTFIRKTSVYGGFGLICVISMYGSGWHIFDFVTNNGQHWTTGIAYVFITDAPMLLAAGILIEKVPTSRPATNTSKQTSVTVPAKAVKATTPKKVATPAKTASEKKPTTQTKAALVTVPSFSAAEA